MYTLEELQRIFGDSFYVYCGQHDTEYHIRFLFGSVFVGESKDGESKFLVGTRATYTSIDPWKEEKMKEISPEDQKKIREEERKEKNNKLVRDLKKSKQLKQKFDSVPIGRRTTKSKELFAPKLTLIKGGLDD
jgi:hypothetical protein